MKLQNQYIVVNDISTQSKIMLDDYFKDFEQDYGFKLKYTVTHIPENASVVIQSSDNCLIITPNNIAGKDSITIEAKDINKQIVSQTFKIFSEENVFEITGSNFIKIHEYYNQDSLVYDFNTSIDGAEDLTYTITRGNDLNIFSINNMGELRVINQPELFKQTSYKDSTFFDLSILAKISNTESSINTRVYSQSIYKVSDGGKNTMTDIEKIKNMELMVFPNPANDYIEINANQIIKKVVVFNLRGREIKSFELNHVKNKLEISDLKPGFYIFKIITNTNTVNKRILVN